MPKFCANIGFLFQELPFLERFQAAADAGFKAVEFAPPYGDHKPDEFAGKLNAAGLEQVLINGPYGPEELGGRGLGCLPGQTEAFRDSIGTALEMARALGATKVHVLSGLRPKDVPEEVLVQTFKDNLAWAGDTLGAHGISACVEAINDRVDNPGYFMSQPRLSERIVREVGHPHVRLQFDFYHWQIMHGDIARAFAEVLPLIGHVQVADTPGRFEPGTGEINYAFIFRMLDSIGYDDWVGAEYKPRGDTVKSLGWIKPYL